MELLTIRERLALVMAISYVTSAAPRASVCGFRPGTRIRAFLASMGPSVYDLPDTENYKHSCALIEQIAACSQDEDDPDIILSLCECEYILSFLTKIDPPREGRLVGRSEGRAQPRRRLSDHLAKDREEYLRNPRP